MAVAYYNKGVYAAALKIYHQSVKIYSDLGMKKTEEMKYVEKMIPLTKDRL